MHYLKFMVGCLFVCFFLFLTGSSGSRHWFLFSAPPAVAIVIVVVLLKINITLGHINLPGALQFHSSDY